MKTRLLIFGHRLPAIIGGDDTAHIPMSSRPINWDNTIVSVSCHLTCQDLSHSHTLPLDIEKDLSHR